MPIKSIDKNVVGGLGKQERESAHCDQDKMSTLFDVNVPYYSSCQAEVFVIHIACDV